MPTVLVRRGERFSVRAWGSDDDCELLDFLDDAERVNARDREAIFQLIAYSADYGPPARNPQKCKPLEDGIFEFKAPRGTRVLWLYDRGAIIVCSHGFVKKQSKTPRGQIDRARAIRDAYRKETGNP